MLVAMAPARAAAGDQLQLTSPGLAPATEEKDKSRCALEKGMEGPCVGGTQQTDLGGAVTPSALSDCSIIRVAPGQTPVQQRHPVYSQSITITGHWAGVLWEHTLGPGIIKVLDHHSAMQTRE
ncbi:hypothetical protein NDU88_000941 [Pleurodeles waltl]|uniref:Uncharacterized protein n=1 Tax=Pleurodeles waltl TaxID=8319 RepID=A0AAV7P5M9_PLEWA|nr:hypothetical protein NDU88_000941 [Pleurodeles waltl]